MKKSKPGRGGSRPGSGRPPGKVQSANGKTFDMFPSAAGAIVKALADANQYQFVAAMQALEAPLKETREAFGQTEQQFAGEWGEFLLATSGIYEHNRAEVRDLCRRFKIAGAPGAGG